ncbi:MAG: hypothetical protein M3Z02_12330 [Actinomycetota bacterium]|nr:hypothetical protein [Actinomycetota bacterium]
MTAGARGPALVLLVGVGTLVVFAGAAGAGPAVAGPAVAGAVDAGPMDGDAVRLLQRAALAAREQPFAGTEFVSSWSRGVTTSAVVDVAHLPGQGSFVQVRPSSSGTPATVFEADAAGDPDDARAGAGPALDSSAIRLLSGHYDVTVTGTASCAGHQAAVIEASRLTTGGGLAGRFWVDRDSGLVLRRELFDATGRTVRASAFVAIDVDAAAAASAKVAAAAPPPRLLSPTAAKQLRPADLDVLRRDGWTVPAILPGDLTLYDARGTGDGPGAVVHLSYSDGLATVSVFEQRGRLGAGGPRDFAKAAIGGHEVYLRSALPDRVVWAGAGRVFTVVADAAPETVEAVVGALPHQASTGGLAARLHRGVQRVFSWLNPFG